MDFLVAVRFFAFLAGVDERELHGVVYNKLLQILLNTAGGPCIF